LLKRCGELSLVEIAQTVRQCLSDGELAGALDAVRDAVDTVINNQRSVARVYASRHLDKLCEQIAQAVSGHTSTQPSMSNRGGGTVILATELAAAGGHVEVIKDLVRLGNMPEPVELLLTDNFQRIEASVQQGYADAMGITLRIAAGADSGERLRDALAFLAERRAHTVVLLVHNQDAPGVVAGLACAAEKVMFVHHGDHHLSLGVTCARMAHVDLSNTAFFNCRNSLGIQENIYWPLILSSQQLRQRTGPFLQQGQPVTCCVGRPEKFDDPSYQYQYLDLVGFILHCTGGRHLHVGQLRDEQMQRIKAGLARHNIDSDRFEHVPWVASVSQALTAHQVDLFLTSFPYGGGKTQVEVMGSAIPTLIHANYRSKVLCGIDLGYPGILTWRDEQELEQVLRSLSPDLLEQQSALAKRHFDQHHCEDALRRALHAPSTRDEDVPPLAEVHSDGLQAFLDEERLLLRESTHEELKQLKHTLAQQAAEMLVLRKKARFLGSVRHKLKMLLKG
jgi:hypothetical protein